MLCHFLWYSKVDQLYIYIYSLFFRFFSHWGHYRILSRLPCAIKYCLTFLFFFFFWFPGSIHQLSWHARSLVPFQVSLYPMQAPLLELSGRKWAPITLCCHLMARTSHCIGFNSTALDVFQEKAMAPHSSTLAWKIPWVEEPGRLKSMGPLRIGHDWVTSLSLFTFMHWRRKWQPTPVFLPRESQGRGSLVGCHLWGCTELDTTEAT